MIENSRQARLIQLELYLGAEKENRKLRQQRADMWGLWNRFMVYWFLGCVLVAADAFGGYQSDSWLASVLAFVSRLATCFMTGLLGYVLARHEGQQMGR